MNVLVMQNIIAFNDEKNFSQNSCVGDNITRNTDITVNKPSLNSRILGRKLKAVFIGIIRYKVNLIVIPPNSNMFSDWRRMCRMQCVKTHSLG